MMNEENRKRAESLSARARLTWGSAAQIIKTLEECAELITVLAKELNGSPYDGGAIVDELADVQFMLFQMTMLFASEERVNTRISFKLDRLEAALTRKETNS